MSATAKDVMKAPFNAYRYRLYCVVLQKKGNTSQKFCNNLILT